MLARVLQPAFFCVVACPLIFGQTRLRVPEKPNPDLYRTNVNAQKEVDDAIMEATRLRKRILLVFGANWCGDCHALDYAFHQPSIGPLLTTNYKVVHVNVGQFNQNLDLAKKYRVVLEKGIPSIAVLDAAGNVLADSSEFENARAMTEEDVLKFLNKWKPAARPN